MIKKYFSSAPILFPIIGLFLMLYTGYIIVDLISFGSTDLIYNLKIVPLLIYTILWMGICFLSRKALIGFIVFTVLMMLTYFIIPDNKLKDFVLSMLIEPLPVNIALSLIILIFYQKIDGRSREIKLKELKE